VSHDGRFARLHVDVPRQYSSTSYAPYATVGEVTLHHPARRVERIGFHESGHDGARQQEPRQISTVSSTMSSRNRGNGSRTAADIAIHPDDEIRSPVTGTVIRAGTYTLYCKYSDHYLVIEPDARPGYEVKVLHFEGLSVQKGDRVVAGQTRVGSNVRTLPFESQIDKTTADPSNGHIHIEVVDPTIPDRPSGGGC
jgi:murein DD-endopeptidase MepM/ murein hydrolase activator NlpD